MYFFRRYLQTLSLTTKVDFVRLFCKRGMGIVEELKAMLVWFPRQSQCRHHRSHLNSNYQAV